MGPHSITMTVLQYYRLSHVGQKGYCQSHLRATWGLWMDPELAAQAHDVIVSPYQYYCVVISTYIRSHRTITNNNGTATLRLGLLAAMAS